MSTFQIENNDLRELSHAEQLEVNGGKACYKNPVGARNDFRFVVLNSNTINQEKWNGSKYVFFKAFPRDISFSEFCKRGGFINFA